MDSLKKTVGSNRRSSQQRQLAKFSEEADPEHVQTKSQLIENELQLSQQNTICHIKPTLKRPQCLDECETQRNSRQKKLANVASTCASTIEQAPQMESQNKKPDRLSRKKANPEKIQQILNSVPLREKYRDLLPQHMVLPIGFHQVKLLDKVLCLDRSIIFMRQHRAKKASFFEDLKKNINQCLGSNISFEDVQRILFVAPGFYSVSWEMNHRIKRHDIILRMPSEQGSEDIRKSEFRRAVVDYLTRLHEQFLTNNNLQQDLSKGWHPRFNIQSVLLPQAPLPDHPLDRNISIKSMTDSQVKAIENSKVREVIERERSQTKSESHISASGLLEYTKNHGSYTQRLLQIVRQKEKKLKQAQNKKPEMSVDNQCLFKVLEEVAAIFAEKHISNMFSVTLHDMLHRRLNFMAQSEIKINIGQILKFKSGFLTEVTNPKGIIIRIDKTKHKQAIAESENWKPTD